MVQRLAEIPEHGFANHRGVKVFANWWRSDAVVVASGGATVKQQKGIEDDLKRVDAELELAPHTVDELEFHAPATLAT